MKFQATSCSQCGAEFGPGDHGYSHCEDHRGDPMTDETIRRWCHSEMCAHVDSEIHRRAKAILVLVDNAVAPPWLADAAEALGEVRPIDGAPKALNWTQVIEAIHELREDLDHWKKRAEAAEFSLGMCRDECAALRQNETIIAEQACPEWMLR